MSTEDDNSPPVEITLDGGAFGSMPPGMSADSVQQSAIPSDPATTTTTTTTEVIRPQDLSLDEDDDDIDESLAERLWGLTEMFPDGLRNAVGALSSLTVFGTQALFTLSKKATWLAASSATILVLPVMFEAERAQLQEQQVQQQRQILLGPNAAVSGAGSGSGLLPGAMPGVMPVPMPQR